MSILEISMRTTIALDDELVKQAEHYTGIKEKAALVREALTRLVRNEAARRLAALGGSDPAAEATTRRRGEE
jgi:Arc/MetJ family transcription regulator